MNLLATLLVSLIILLLPLTESCSAQSQRPNIVVVVLDDANAESMQLGLPKTKALIADRGVILPNFITTTPECGPSRASMLRGQYTHNHRVLTNGYGFPGFRDTGMEAGDEPVPPVKAQLQRKGQYPLTTTLADGIDERRANRYLSMLYVDDLIVNVVNTLKAIKRMDNTLFIVVSDNGWHQGEHSIPRDKGTAYKEALSPPMWVRGPGVIAGRTDLRLAATHDLAPTFLRLAKQPVPSYMNGRDMRPLLYAQRKAHWRTAILGQSYSRYDWKAVQTDEWKLVVWKGGYRELYNIDVDPWERTNLAEDPARTPKLAELMLRLQDLKACGTAGAVTCQEAEDQ
jgi:arylsulfatase A-like enzyme